MLIATGVAVFLSRQGRAVDVLLLMHTHVCTGVPRHTSRQCLLFSLGERAASSDPSAGPAGTSVVLPAGGEPRRPPPRHGHACPIWAPSRSLLTPQVSLLVGTHCRRAFCLSVCLSVPPARGPAAQRRAGALGPVPFLSCPRCGSAVGFRPSSGHVLFPVLGLPPILCTSPLPRFPPPSPPPSLGTTDVFPEVLSVQKALFREAPRPHSLYLARPAPSLPCPPPVSLVSGFFVPRWAVPYFPSFLHNN